MDRNPKLDTRVTFADGTEKIIRPTLEDTLAFETTLRKNRHWGSLEDSVLKMQPFRAWNCLRRQGLTDLSWDEFTTGPTAVLDVQLLADEDDGEPNLAVVGLGKDTPKGRSTSSPSASPSEPAPAPGTGEAKALS